MKFFNDSQYKGTHSRDILIRHHRYLFLNEATSLLFLRYLGFSICFDIWCSMFFVVKKEMNKKRIVMFQLLFFFFPVSDSLLDTSKINLLLIETGSQNIFHAIMLWSLSPSIHPCRQSYDSSSLVVRRPYESQSHVTDIREFFSYDKSLLWVSYECIHTSLYQFVLFEDMLSK